MARYSLFELKVPLNPNQPIFNNNNNNNNTSICKAHNVSIRAESEAPNNSPTSPLRSPPIFRLTKYLICLRALG